MVYNRLIFLGLVTLSGPCFAQDGEPDPIIIADPIREDYITVLANGERQPLDRTGKTVSIFTREDIEAVQGADFTRLIERAPGIGVSRNGGPGAFTAVHSRGAEGEQLLVLLDGVRVADPASPGGGFDFGNLLMGNFEKIELLRSSNSTIWGSQAIGGVLVATSGSTHGYFGSPASASAEYGAHDSFYGTAGVQLRQGPASVNFQAGRYSSDGFSAAANGSEPDGFSQTEFSGRASVQLGSGLNAFAAGRLADGRADIDGFPAPDFVLADTAEYQDTRQRSGAAGIAYHDDAFDLRATASLADTERDSFDPALGDAPAYTTDGTSERAELRGRWRFDEELALDFGGEREWTRFSTLFDPVRRTAITGVYAQLDYGGEPLHIAAGVRHDEHRDFGGEWSLGADASWSFAYDWRATLSYGEGFKAPTLFQLHSDFGNASLRPERSRSYDAGLSYAVYGLQLGLTAFRRDTRGLIGFVSCFGDTGGICTDRPSGTYGNIGRARAQGLEAEAEYDVTDGVSLGASYTLLDAEDHDTGNDLPRRPKHALTATASWRPIAPLSLGADLRVVSGSFDDAANLIPLAGYETLTLRASWDASNHVTLFGRVENLWDEHYETAAGYGTPGRAAYIGARAKW